MIFSDFLKIILDQNQYLHNSSHHNIEISMFQKSHKITKNQRKSITACQHAFQLNQSCSGEFDENVQKSTEIQRKSLIIVVGKQRT